MLIVIPQVLSAAEVQQFRTHIAQADWQDGVQTAGSLARHVKQNLQLSDTAEPALSLGKHILRALAQTPLFISAALPARIYPPKFNCYRNGGHYGAHIDGSLMQLPNSHLTLRTDLSATLFLNEPEDYDGGELSIDTRYGTQTVKLAAGDMVLYPSTSLHQVTPVTRGERLAAFFWIQSQIQDNTQRELLFDLDQSIQRLTVELGSTHAEVVRLSGVYHNLIRQWAVA